MPPSNWYRKTKKEDSRTSRYYGTLSANIVIPENIDKEQEREDAYNALNQALPTSGFINDSIVNFNIEGVTPHV